MNECLGDAASKYCFVYLDDIIVYSQTVEEHAQPVRDVLGRLRDNGFVLKRAKCVFGVEELPFLGHVVGDGRLAADSVKEGGAYEAGPT